MQCVADVKYGAVKSRPVATPICNQSSLFRTSDQNFDYNAHTRCFPSIRMTFNLQTSQTLCNQLAGLPNDVVDQLMHGRYIIYQASCHATTPHAGFHITLLHDTRIDTGDFFPDVIEFDVITQRFLLFDETSNGGVD